MSNVSQNFERAINQGQVMYATDVTPLKKRVLVGRKTYNGKSYPVLAPEYNAYVSGVNRCLNTLSLSPSPASNFFNGTNVYTYNVLPGSINDKVRAVRLNLPLSVSSSSLSISPPNMGIIRIEFYNGDNTLIYTCYDTDIMIRWNLYRSKFEFDQFANNVGLTTSWSPNTTQLNISSGASLYLSVPIVTIFDALGLHFEKITESILIKVYSRSLTSSGSGTLALTSPSLTFDIDIDADRYRKQVDVLYDNNILKTNYLDCFLITGSYSMTATQATKISLQNIAYKCPFLVFCIRANNSTCTNNNLNNFVSLGSLTDATQYNVALQNPIGLDLLNNGQGLSPTDMQMINANLCTQNLLFVNQNLYFVPFCTNLQSALVGNQASGFLYFDATSYNLQLIPGTSFSSSTYFVDIYVYYFRCAEICKGKINVCNY